MSKITVKIECEAWDAIEFFDQAEPEMTITIETPEITSIAELEGLFYKVAQAAGFTYVGAVDCKILQSLEVKE